MDAIRSNTAVVADGFEAFKAGDVDRLLGNLSEEIDWEVLGLGDRVPTGGRRLGHEEVRRFFRDLSEGLDFTAFDVTQMVGQGEHVVALGRYASRVKATGRSMSAEFAMVFRVVDGKVVSFREYTDTGAILEAWGAIPGVALLDQQPQAIEPGQQTT